MGRAGKKRGIREKKEERRTSEDGAVACRGVVMGGWGEESGEQVAT